MVYGRREIGTYDFVRYNEVLTESRYIAILKRIRYTRVHYIEDRYIESRYIEVLTGIRYIGVRYIEISLHSSPSFRRRSNFVAIVRYRTIHIRTHLRQAITTNITSDREKNF